MAANRRSLELLHQLIVGSPAIEDNMVDSAAIPVIKWISEADPVSNVGNIPN